MTREEEICHLLREVFMEERSRLAGYKVVLFGSRARGDAGPRSDFDIGVIGATPMPLANFYHLADRIEELPTLYRIDWVDLARASDTFRRNALADSEVIHED
uniref:Polymerase beta nucleotidyltransferase domain-containing protein n=1 Tax=Candidatus Kentrum sp. FW TaxID=2126338 RepID=A0A450TF04_9GAMM|nr:MAG: hypothetical protein BECKFW1821C_GA0114237_100827 [Candidatus Kentron sp. FW]